MPEDDVIVDDKATWTSSLSEEYRSLPSISKFKTADDLAKSYVNLEKLVGTEKLPIPKDEKDEAGWATVYNRLGRPESADKYQVELKLAEGLSVPDEAMNGFKQAAFKAGLSNRQIQAIMGYWADIENAAYNQRLEADKNSVIESETSMRRKFGPSFESAKKNVEAFVKLHYPNSKVDSVMGRLLRDPEEFEAVFNASKNFSEDALKVGKPAAFSLEEARAEANRMMMDANGPFRSSIHPEHDAAVKKYNDLMALIYKYENQ